MKTLLTSLAAVFLSLGALAQGAKYSDFPNSSTLQSGDLFLFSRAGNGTFNINKSQMLSAFDAAGAATAATNGYPWGPLYDPSGRAVSVTNGFPWGVLYDAAGTAQTVANTTSNLLQGHIDGLGANLTNDVNTTSNVLAGLITGAGINASTATNISQSVANTTSNLLYGLEVPQSRTITIAGTANQITSSAGAQDLSANRTATLSLPSTLIAPGSVSATTFLGLDQWQIGTNAANHQLVMSNTIYAGVLTLTTNGILALNGVPLLGAAALGANHHVGSDGATNLINQEDFTGYTNSVSFTNFGTTTNMVLTFNGNLNSGLTTNGPDLFPTFAAAGNGSGSWSIKYTSNITFHLPPQIKWLAGSNNVGTNGVISFTAFGGTNLVEAALKENQ